MSETTLAHEAAALTPKFVFEVRVKPPREQFYNLAQTLHRLRQATRRIRTGASLKELELNTVSEIDHPPARRLRGLRPVDR